jgi:hypothetical protein
MMICTVEQAYLTAAATGCFQSLRHHDFSVSALTGTANNSQNFHNLSRIETIPLIESRILNVMASSFAKRIFEWIYPPTRGGKIKMSSFSAIGEVEFAGCPFLNTIFSISGGIFKIERRDSTVESSSSSIRNFSSPVGEKLAKWANR